MPELPEVETIKNGLQVTKNTTIKEVTIRNTNLRWPITPKLEKILKNQKIISITRRGKYLLLKTNTGTLIIHLGMSGSLRIVKNDTSLKKHDHVDILLDNGTILRYHDPRRFGSILWTETDPLQHALIKTIGLEPLDEDFTAEYLYQKTKNRSLPVKNFIMDSKIVAGVGNIYAAESLFLAKINPHLPTKNLTIAQCEKLVEAIKTILKAAINAGGTTLKDYVNSEGKPGYFSQKLYVYGRTDEQCLECNSTLKSAKLGQRATVFCESCQAI